MAAVMAVRMAQMMTKRMIPMLVSLILILFSRVCTRAGKSKAFTCAHIVCFVSGFCSSETRERGGEAHANGLRRVKTRSV